MLDVVTPQRVGETAEHQALKKAVADACAAAGWDAVIEAGASGFRADVLAVRGGERRAFEVQLSGQTAEALYARQRRYEAAGIDAVWLWPRKALPATADLAVFQLVREGNAWSIEHDTRMFTLAEFVRLVLERSIRFFNELIGRLRVRFVEMQCWRCDEWSHVHWADVESRCGQRSLDARISEFSVLDEVGVWIAQEGRHAGIRQGKIKPRHSRTVGRSYLSFGCAACDAIFGDWFVQQALLEGRIYPEDACASFAIDAHPLARLPLAHWCLPDDRATYCCT